MVHLGQDSILEGLEEVGVEDVRVPKLISGCSFIYKADTVFLEVDSRSHIAVAHPLQILQEAKLLELESVDVEGVSGVVDLTDDHPVLDLLHV